MWFCAGWVPWVASGLQVVGGGFALWGLVRTYRHLDRMPAFLERLGGGMRSAGRWIVHRYRRLANKLRRLVGLKGRPTVVAAGASAAASARAFGVGKVQRYGRRMQRPDRELEKLRDDLLDLEGRVGDLQHGLVRARRELREEIGEEREARERGDQEVRQFAGALLADAQELEVIAAGAILFGLALATFASVAC